VIVVRSKTALVGLTVIEGRRQRCGLVILVSFCAHRVSVVLRGLYSC
jgi:hypothetical protein